MLESLGSRGVILLGLLLLDQVLDLVLELLEALDLFQDVLDPGVALEQQVDQGVEVLDHSLTFLDGVVPGFLGEKGLDVLHRGGEGRFLDELGAQADDLGLLRIGGLQGHPKLLHPPRQALERASRLLLLGENLHLRGKGPQQGKRPDQGQSHNQSFHRIVS